MHLDAVAARRTQAGAPVVHGIHLLLWALNELASALPGSPPLRKLRARFGKFIYVGETAEASLTEHTERAAKLVITVDATPVAQIAVEFGDPVPSPQAPLGELPLLALTPIPADIDFAVIADRSGRLPFATPPGQIASMFPAAAAWVTPQRVAALAATTNLVGMVCPGLHSLFSSLTVQTCRDAYDEDSLRFRVTSADPRFRQVRIAVEGGGLTGSLDTFARVPPAAQATMASLVNAADPAEFTGSSALIIGGSRGIGELTAKRIAAGGGHVTITYQLGKSDADKIAHEIISSGGLCNSMHYDVRQPAAAQLENLSDTPTHLYYFATPAIFGRQSEFFSQRRFEEFLAIYVDGFLQLLQALRRRRPDLSVFYPSSVAVAERPRGMTEYAMAKAAGEILCADMNESLAPLRVLVNRLPRMQTDQTATFMPTETASILETVLPLIRQVQAYPVR